MEHHRDFTIGEIEEIQPRLLKTFKSGKTRPLAYRRQQLIQLGRMIQDNMEAIEDAIIADLGKPRFEAGTAELVPTFTSIVTCLNHLEEWTAPEKRVVEEWRSDWDTMVYPVPKGIALIIAPWNYPFVLAFNPLVGAIAAGCPAVVKPSEHAPTIAALSAKLVSQYLDPDSYTVVNGGVPEVTVLLNHRWDHIFYTGNPAVGRIIGEVAGKHLTSVTLELGGKSPAVIAEDCDLDVAARRVLWGKIQNSGQLCVSPDHVYVPRSIIPAFLEALKRAHDKFFPDDPFHPSTEWGKMVNANHHARVLRQLQKSAGKIVLGGAVEGSTRIAPTILSDVRMDDAMMDGEVFGPVLPIIPVDDVDEAIHCIQDGPSPLVIYLFSTSEELKQRFIHETRSGSLIVNDTYIQLLVYELPFGGVGESGEGKYFGKSSFDAFTHRRSMLHVPPALDSTPLFELRYPPYSQQSYDAFTGLLRTKLPEA